MKPIKMKPRVEQLYFGPELVAKIDELVRSIDTIEDLQVLTEKFASLEQIVDKLQLEINEFETKVTEELNNIETIPNLIILDGAITFAGQREILLDIPAKAIELKTVKFNNITNTDTIKAIVSEKNDFSTQDYVSLEKASVYDILNLPIVDRNNISKFKLKVKFMNTTSASNPITINYQIKLTIFALKG